MTSKLADLEEYTAQLAGTITLPIPIDEAVLPEMIEMIKQESLEHKGKFFFAMIMAKNVSQVLVVESQDTVDEILENRPPEGMFVLIKDGEQIDSSDRFIKRVLH